MGEYVCNDCREVFDESIAAYQKERVADYWGYQPAYIKTMICPHCGSDDIIEAAECSICGEHYHPDALYHLTIGDICEECAIDLWHELKDIKEGKK